MSRVSDDFYLGIIVTLGFVYAADDATCVLAQEIVRDVGGASLIRVAKKHEDMNLAKIRATVRSLRRWHPKGNPEVKP